MLLSTSHASGLESECQTNVDFIISKDAFSQIERKNENDADSQDDSAVLPRRHICRLVSHHIASISLMQ